MTTELDRLTAGARERHILGRIRAGSITADDIAVAGLPFFVKIQIQTLSHCNARCFPCPYPATRVEQPQGRMTGAVFSRIIEQIRGRDVERIGLFLMNEPLLDTRLERFIRRLKRALPEAAVLIYTNGLLLTEDRILSLARSGLDEINVSILGFDRETHERTMGGVDFERVLANLRAAARRLRAGALDGMRVRVVGLAPAATPEGARRFAGEVGLDVYRKPVTNRAGNIRRAVRGARTGRPEGRGAARVCQRPFVKAYVLFSGDMILCNCDWRRTTILGNVMEASLETMWRGERLMEIRRAHLRGDLPRTLLCASCDYPHLI